MREELRGGGEGVKKGQKRDRGKKRPPLGIIFAAPLLSFF